MTATKKKITDTIREILARWDELPNRGNLDVNIHAARTKLEPLIEDEKPEDEFPTAVEEAQGAPEPHNEEEAERIQGDDKADKK